MEQQNGFWAGVEEAFHHLLSPFRISAEALFGYSPSDIQIWLFLVAAFMFVLAAPGTYGDIVLMRRSARAAGKVVKIDVGGDDSLDTPVIDFRDASGKLWTFTSELGCNGQDRRHSGGDLRSAQSGAGARGWAAVVQDLALRTVVLIIGLLVVGFNPA